LRRVCVFTGSSPGAQPAYAEAAAELGRTLAGRGLELVYGGSHLGLMGVLADAVLTAGGRVQGVIPEGMVRREVAHEGLTQLHVVRSMHERKALMADLADAFVALPGGLGTLEELAEVLTWAQLGLHEKPCGLLDVAGYWEGLLAFLDHTVAERFVRPEHRALLIADRTPGSLLDRLATWQAPALEKWLDRATT
jgi:uncharacterized protein (TIGR00730 family)